MFSSKFAALIRDLTPGRLVARTKKIAEELRAMSSGLLFWFIVVTIVTVVWYNFDSYQNPEKYGPSEVWYEEGKVPAWCVGKYCN